MTTINAIRATHADELATNRIIEILKSKLDSVIDAEWSRDEAGNCTDGLPLPSVTHYYEQLTPSEISGMYLGNVEIYVGKRAPTEYGSPKQSTSQGTTIKAVLPFSVMIVFVDVPTGNYRHPETDQIMTVEEVNNRRLQRYLGALKSCLFEFGNVGTSTPTQQEAAVWGVELDSDFSTVGPLKVAQDEDRDATVDGQGALGTLSIRVQQWQLLPKYNAL